MLADLAQPPCSARSDGSLVVANQDSEEMVLAPPNCGASVVYRLGYYNIALPKTTHSEENLVHPIVAASQT